VLERFLGQLLRGSSETTPHAHQIIRLTLPALPAARIDATAVQTGLPAVPAHIGALRFGRRCPGSGLTVGPRAASAGRVGDRGRGAGSLLRSGRRRSVRIHWGRRRQIPLPFRGIAILGQFEYGPIHIADGDRMNATPGVLDAVARLRIRINLKPISPAGVAMARGLRGIEIQPVAMLEAHVALVDGLHARATSRERQRACKADDYVEQSKRLTALHPDLRVPGFAGCSKLASRSESKRAAVGACPFAGSDSPGRCYLAMMFTGLVETTGRLRQQIRKGPGYRLSIKTDLAELLLGESVAVNGVCLTVARTSEDGFEADVSVETSQKTTLGQVAPGALVNLERSLAFGDRLGGHLVSGHVDGLAVVIRAEPVGEALLVELAIGTPFRRYVAKKGSVALDGISLTVNELTAAGFEIMLIPHTLAVTNLRDLKVGRELNLEVDLLARYVVQCLDQQGQGVGPNRAASAVAERDAELRAALERAGIL
jgi:riboflavin synthase